MELKSPSAQVFLNSPRRSQPLIVILSLARHRGGTTGGSDAASEKLTERMWPTSAVKHRQADLGLPGLESRLPSPGSVTLGQGALLIPASQCLQNRDSDDVTRRNKLINIGKILTIAPGMQ